MRGEFVDVAGVRLYCYAAGSRGRGSPLLLIHGFPGSSHTWAELVPLLPAGRRVVVVDLACSGRSDPAPEDTLSTTGHGERCLRLLDLLGVERFAVMGHAFGACVALRMAMATPDRVESLVLVSPPSPDDWPTPTGGTVEWASLAVPGVPPEWSARLVGRSVRRGFLDPTRGAHSADQVLRPHVTSGFGPFRAQAAALAREREAGFPEVSGVLPPSTVIRGALDSVTDPLDAERLVARLPGATLHVIPDVGFSLPEEAPERLASLLTRVLFRE